MKIYVIGENTKKSQTRRGKRMDQDGDRGGGSCQQCDVRYGCRIERNEERERETERENTKLSRTRSNIEFDTGVPSQYPLPLRLPDTARGKWCLDRDREAALERQEGTLHHNYEIA